MKRILILALAFALCLSLCSCNYLDELKATQFTWGDINKTTIVSRDGRQEYVELPDDVNLSLDIITTSQMGYLVSGDVPLLLGSYNFDSLLWIYEESGVVEVDANGGIRFFCLADRYDAIVDFANGNSDLGFFYYSHEINRTKVVKLTEEEKALIDNTVATGEEKVEAYDVESDVLPVIELYRVNEELSLADYDGYDIGIKENADSGEVEEYYIIVYKEEAKHLYKIPAEHNPTFKNLTHEANW